jgi:hypothetical protein
MPRATTSLALVLAAVSLLACGQERAAPARKAPAVTRSRALAFAHAVNLTAADVPGFSAHRERAQPKAHAHAEAELFTCAGSRSHAARAHSADLASSSSPSFQLRRGILDFGVSSEVGVARSSQLALGELAAIHSSRVRECFRRYLGNVLASSRTRGASVGAVAIEAGNPPAAGTAGTFGWRVRATFDFAGASIPTYLDLLGFVYGPARVTLISSGALRPFPAVVQQRLFSLLLLRAHAHGF